MIKRYLSLLFAFALIVAACGGATEEAADVVEETPTTDAPVEETTTTEPPVETEPAGPADGQTVYEENCARCHGADGTGGRGSSLVGIATEQPDTAAAIEQVQLGGSGMPAFGNTLTAEEIEAAVNYIFTTF